MDSYRSAIDGYALSLRKHLSPMPNQIDNIGNDQDDYFQMLRLKALEAIDAFRKREKPRAHNSEIKWAFVALRNYAQTIHRKRISRPLRLSYQPELDDRLIDDVFENLANRDLVSQLRKHLSSKDWDTLIIVSVEENTRKAWQQSGAGTSMRQHYNRVLNARRNARRIFERI